MRPYSTANTGHFYIQENGDRRTLLRTFQEVRGAQQKDSYNLDLVAICEAMGSCAFLGDRTIIQNIRRTPWLSEFSADGSVWRANTPPAHGSSKDSSENMAERLFEALKREISNVIGDKTRIGILLSGGMDSRIVAGMLRLLQRERNGFSVTVFCWGIRHSRDPVYAERIANLYGWDFEHFDISAETLKRNIAVSADEGCFYAANHLHAMPDVGERAKALGTECIIAGSYGDSIGRAEYRGIRVLDLPSIETRLANNFLLIDQNLFEECKKASLKEIERYHEQFGNRKPWEINELDNQLHYMRNQLGTCMNVIDRNVPLYQAFTSEEVVGLMWSHHPACRGDEVYACLLKLIDPELLEFPWARTGKRYLQDNDRPDDLEKRYHKYGKWCREDLAEYLDELIFSGELQKTNLLNNNQLKFMLWSNRRFCRTNNRNKIDEISLWLASFALFLKNNNWHIDNKIESDSRRSPLGYWKIMRFAATFVFKHNRINA